MMTSTHRDPPPAVVAGQVYWYERQVDVRTKELVLARLTKVNGYGGYGEIICLDGEVIQGGIYLPSILIERTVSSRDLQQFTERAVTRLRQHLAENFQSGPKLAKTA